MITCEIFCFLYYIQSLVLYLFPSLHWLPAVTKSSKSWKTDEIQMIILSKFIMFMIWQAKISFSKCS